MPPPFSTTDTRQARTLPPPRCPSSELADLRETSRLAEATVSLPLIGVMCALRLNFKQVVGSPSGRGLASESVEETLDTPPTEVITVWRLRRVRPVLYLPQDCSVDAWLPVWLPASRKRA